MARIHARRKGKSGSHRPYPREHPEWSKVSPSEAEEMVINLAREGHAPAKIGLILRDQHGIPDVKAATGKKLQAILDGAGLKPEIPEDLTALLKSVATLNEHLREHPSDLHNRRGLALVQSKIHRLVKYYKASGRVPAAYSPFGPQAAATFE